MSDSAPRNRAEIHFVVGDIFSYSADVFVNPVNCAGTMGKGLALQFKERFPDINFPYLKACEARIIKPGQPALVPSRTNGRQENPWVPLVCLFPTKDHWRDQSRIEWVRRGLEWCCRNQPEGLLRDGDHRPTWAFPLLGAGLGGLDVYDVVLNTILELRFAPFNAQIYVDTRMEMAFDMACHKIASLEIFDRFDRAVMGIDKP